MGGHLAVVENIFKVLEGSRDVEIHPNVLKRNGVRKLENGYDTSLLCHRYYSAVEVNGDQYRVMIMVMEHRPDGENHQITPYAVEVQAIELTKIKLSDVPEGEIYNTTRWENASKSYVVGAKLLKGVEKSYDKGVKVLDVDYFRAIEAGDMETAQRMVLEAAKLAMPNTKVVDENGEPKVVYHGTPHEFTVFGKETKSKKKHTFKDTFFFNDSEEVAKSYGKLIPVFLNITNPIEVDFEGGSWRGEKIEIAVVYDRTGAILKSGFNSTEEAETWKEAFLSDNPAYAADASYVKVDDRAITGRGPSTDEYAKQAKEEGYDGCIFTNVTDAAEYELADTPVTDYVAFSPSQIKSADPVTYDDAGNVIPLSERFNPENADIRFRVANENQAIFVSNAARAVEGIKMEKATPEQWLKMIEKNGGLKAGEDKWMGLSDWLKASDKKTLTKVEVLDFINENMIIIEEEKYGEVGLSALQEEFNEIYDNIIDNVGNEDESDLQLWEVVMNPMERAWEELRDRYSGGDDFDMAFSYDSNGNIEINDPDVAGYFLGVKPINDTRLDYTTSGLQNKQEIALVIPAIESWNERDEVHFGDAGDGRAVAWIRFGETKKLLGTTEVDGKKKFNWARVLVIDEIQSKRHQEGREEGYRVTNIDKWLKDNNVEVIETGEFFEFIKNGEPDRRFSKGLMNYDIEKAKRLYVSGYNKSDIPDAPFDKNWHELAMKRMLRYAAENGYDVIAWTKGDQQAERYNIGKVIDSIYYGNLNGNKIVRLTLYGADNQVVEVDSEGRVVAVHSGNMIQEGMSLAEIVGKEIALKIMNNEGEKVGEDDYKLSGEGLRVGGEGMKGFYDRMLPAFMNKYGKKWGVKVEDIHLNLEGGLDMHSVPVTEEMKASVMEGQVMFRVRGENESPMEFEQSVLGDFKKEYNLPTSTTVVDVNDRDALAAALGYTLEEFTDEMYNDILEGYQMGGTAFYERDTKRIAIFVKESIRNSVQMYNHIFHENTHYLEDENPEILELGEWLWQNSEPELRRKIKEAIIDSGMYEGEEAYEMLAAYAGYVMSQGKADVAYEKTPSELQKHWELIFNAFGYEPRGKEIRRRGTGDNSGRVGSLRDRRDAEAEMPTQQSDIQDLTAEERRIIGEYFPEFNKSEDVRMRVNSQGKELTEGQREFFANSKAVDKDGNLLVLYHGTPRAGFTEFKSGWFTTSKEDAVSYSGDRKGRLFDPNEEYVPETLSAGDFRLGYMTFDSEEDRAAFLERFPYADEVMSEREYEDARMEAEDEEYDALTARRKEFAEVWNAYREYERERFVDSPIADIIANPVAPAD